MSHQFGAAALIPQELLAGPRCQITGRPLDETPRMADSPWAAKARNGRDKARFQAWIDLSCQQRSQLVCQLRYPPKPGESWWHCSMTGKYASKGGQIDLIVSAVDHLHAEGRYKEISGLTAIDPQTWKLVCVPYTPPVEEVVA